MQQLQVSEPMSCGGRWFQEDGLHLFSLTYKQRPSHANGRLTLLIQSEDLTIQEFSWSTSKLSLQKALVFGSTGIWHEELADAIHFCRVIIAQLICTDLRTELAQSAKCLDGPDTLVMSAC